MAKCIYCGADADSGEHWMPKTFGTFKNFEQLFDRLCADCNKALGDELDQEVANTGTTALAKAHLGIEGRHKGKPSKNPFQYRVMGPDAANHATFPSLVMLGISQKRITHRIHQFTYYDEKTDNFNGELTELPSVKLVRVERN